MRCEAAPDKELKPLSLKGSLVADSNWIGITVAVTSLSQIIMLVKDREDQTLIQVMNPEELIDPFKQQIQGRQKAGQEVQPTRAFDKSRLIFPSGETLPQCWMDPEYHTE